MWAVYLCGCTDCFVHALFMDLGDAEAWAQAEWAKVPNPEGYRIVFWRTPADMDTSDTGWDGRASIPPPPHRISVWEDSRTGTARMSADCGETCGCTASTNVGAVAPELRADPDVAPLRARVDVLANELLIARTILQGISERLPNAGGAWDSVRARIASFLDTVNPSNSPTVNASSHSQVPSESDDENTSG